MDGGFDRPSARHVTLWFRPTTAGTMAKKARMLSTKQSSL